MKEKKYILMLFALLFLSPLLLRSVKIKIGKPLYELDDKKSLTKVGWSEILDESFQKTVENSFRLDNGLSNLFVRTKNQVDYSMFHDVNLNSVLLGEKKHVYQNFYIDAYLGKDFKGDDYFSDQCRKLLFVQKTLEAKGKGFLFVLAPSKASFFPEYLPGNYSNDGNERYNNETSFEKHCKLKGIHFVNFDNWFIQMKDTSRYPLFPQGEVHWSSYGAGLAADSLLRYLKMYYSPTMSSVKKFSVGYSGEFPRMDNYIGDRMNLLFLQDYYPTATPYIEWDTTGKTKPNLLTISDSFFNNIETTGFFNTCFSSRSIDINQNNMAHSVFNKDFYLDKNHYVLKDELLSRDLIIILVTVPNLSRGTWGFVDEAFALLQEEEKNEKK